MKKILLFAFVVIAISGCKSHFEKVIDSYPQLTFPYTLDFFADSTYTFEELDTVTATEFFKQFTVKEGAEEYIYVADYIDLFYTKDSEFENVLMNIVGCFKKENFTGVIVLLDIYSDVQPNKMLLLYTFDKEGKPIDACVISNCYIVPNGWEPSMQEAYVEINEDLTITNNSHYSSYSRSDPEAEGVDESNEYIYKIDENGKISF